MGKYKKLYLEAEGKRREYAAALVKAEDEAAKYRSENDGLLDNLAVLKAETEVLSKELRELKEKKEKGLRSQCEGCTYFKHNPQKCASCIRNPNAKDKFTPEKQ